MVVGTLANRNKVQVGQTIKFFRKDAYLVGDVIEVRENTVMIEVCETAAKTLDIPNNLTVVNHKHYELLEA